MKHILASAAFLLATTAAVSAADTGGNYTVYGTNFDGSPYKGTAVIRSSPSSCQIEWTTGGVTSTGICMLSGAVLGAAYQLGGDMGLALYDVRDDGTLDGVWSIEGKDGSGTEVLTPAN